MFFVGHGIEAQLPVGQNLTSAQMLWRKKESMGKSTPKEKNRKIKINTYNEGRQDPSSNQTRPV